MSAARNRGIQLARGRYIQFVDSDDILREQQIYPALIELADAQNVPIVRTMFDSFYTSEPAILSWLPLTERSGKLGTWYCVSGHDYALKMIAVHYFPVVWNGIFQAAFLRKNHILFDEEQAYGEDALFLFDALSVENCSVLDVKYLTYSYRSHPESAVAHFKKFAANYSNSQAASKMWQRQFAIAPERADAQQWQVMAQSTSSLMFAFSLQYIYDGLAADEQAIIRQFYTPEIVAAMKYYWSYDYQF